MSVCNLLQSTTQAEVMTSLKRSLASDPYASNISSKVFVRSTKSGKVQKIVRELYLRQDIPCSSRLCTSCLSNAPRDAGGSGKIESIGIQWQLYLLTCYSSCPIHSVRKACWHKSLSTRSLSRPGYQCSSQRP
jgi:hypothetical protein